MCLTATPPSSIRSLSAAGVQSAADVGAAMQTTAVSRSAAPVPASYEPAPAGLAAPVRPMRARQGRRAPPGSNLRRPPPVTPPSRATTLVPPQGQQPPPRRTSNAAHSDASADVALTHREPGVDEPAPPAVHGMWHCQAPYQHRRGSGVREDAARLAATASGTASAAAVVSGGGVAAATAGDNAPRVDGGRIASADFLSGGGGGAATAAAGGGGW